MTLLELMIVIAIVGILSAIALPMYDDYVFRAKLSGMILQLDSIADRVREYKAVTGRYPPDTHVVPPPGVGMPDYWYTETLLGGNYNWEGPDRYSYAGVSILGATAEQKHLEYFDRLLDDGDLTTGKFRRTANGRHTYILDE